MAPHTRALAASCAWLITIALPLQALAQSYNTGTYNGTGDYNVGVVSSSSSSSSVASSVASSSSADAGGGGGGGGGGRRSGPPSIYIPPSSTASAGSAASQPGTAPSSQSNSDSGTPSAPGTTGSPDVLIIKPVDAERAIPFRDVHVTSWYSQSVATLIERGIVSGYKSEDGRHLGLFGPADPITYAEAAKIALEAGRTSNFAVGAPKNQAALFHWASRYIAQAEEVDPIVYIATLEIDSPAPRGAVLHTLMRAFGISAKHTSSSPYRDLRPSHPFAEAILTATELGIVSGDTDASGKPIGTFRPNDPIVRAEVAKIVAKLLALPKE